jgi:beta-lactamase superfamily II metal-dependent hydrolase
MRLLRVGIVIGLVLSAGPVAAQTLRIYQIDVEQADAALFVMPNGKTLLIDAGKNGHGQRIRNVMAQAGVTQIDAFVASHYHEDHFGGIDDLVDAGIPVLESFDRGDKECCLSESKKNETTFKDYQRTVGEDARPLRPGDTIALDPLVTITCIASGGFVVGEGEDGTEAEEENDKSVALLITFRGFTAFYGGDTEEPTEDKIAGHDLALNVDLYKASHHGSHSSSSPAFMRDLQPSVVVISNGNHGTFKHPRQVTLDTYASLTPALPVVFQTNKCLRSAPCANVPDAQIADPETTDEDGTILITVNAATSSYTVQYGTTSRTFPVKAPEGPVSTALVVISALLPNPVGDDEQLETVTLRNTGTTSVSLAGWTLQDHSGGTWSLIGSLAPGQSGTFRRNGQAMSLNNAGDEIALVDAMIMERDRFAYSATSEGVEVLTGH